MPAVCPNAACKCQACPTCEEAPGSKIIEPIKPAVLTPVNWSQLPGWGKDDLTQAVPALLRSCSALTLKQNDAWRDACQRIVRWGDFTAAEIQRRMEQIFRPYLLSDGSNTLGRITGYYEPLLLGSLQKTADYPYPVYTQPTDMITVQLDSQYPALKGMRLRGRLDGNTLIPYYNRHEIANLGANMKAPVLLWVNNLVDLMFLEIQGSGRVRLPGGEMLRLNYLNQNGHPFRAIGGYLLRNGLIAANQLSAQSIRAWAMANPSRIADLLEANPSFVFFRIGEGDMSLGPPGTLGVPLTPQRSVAVDQRYIPLGSFLWLDTTFPNSPTPLQRLVTAQDTGGAINGIVRADFFWGFGDEAGNYAGKMKQNLAMWVLLPKSFDIRQFAP